MTALENRGEKQGEEGEEKEGRGGGLDFVLKDGGANLSGGQQQRVGLLRSLQVQRPVMILDEATSDLDEKSRDAVFDILQERSRSGCTIILVTHDRSIADRCDLNLDLSRVRLKA